MNNSTEFLINLFYKLLNKTQSSKQPGVVFDIDGTIIIDGISRPKNNNQIIHSVYNFLLYLQNHNIPIFIITARTDSKDNYEYTHKMLNNLDIKYNRLYLWNQNHYNNPTDYKENARKTLINDYNIIMSLGDNIWDYGKYGGEGVHIHNDGEYFTTH